MEEILRQSGIIGNYETLEIMGFQWVNETIYQLV